MVKLAPCASSKDVLRTHSSFASVAVLYVLRPLTDLEENLWTERKNFIVTKRSTPRPLYFKGNCYPYPSDSRQRGPQTQAERFGEGKNKLTPNIWVKSPSPGQKK